MSDNLASYLCSTAFMKVLRGLYYSNEPRHLRDLSRSYDLSPGGVSDILRRLEELKLVETTKVKNRKCYTLKASSLEQNFLDQLFHSYEKAFVRERAASLEKDATQKFEWMDDAYQFFKEVKQLNADSS